MWYVFALDGNVLKGALGASYWFTAVASLTARSPCARWDSDESDPLLKNLHSFVRPLSVPIMMSL